MSGGAKSQIEQVKMIIFIHVMIQSIALLLVFQCYRRVRAILKTELNSANRIEAINTLATLVVTYSFNIVNWTLSDIKKIDTKIRKLMSCNRMHHSKADVDRLYIPRKDGGRGLIQLELSLKTAAIGLQRYLETT